jgi:hypothetical protein
LKAFSEFLIRLSEKTMKGIVGELASYDQTPTAKMVEGLRTVAEGFEAMAEGGLPPQVHLASLAAGMCDEEKVGRDVLAAVKTGEHAHGILQALCRAAVRGVGNDGRCKPCRAHIIASSQSGIPQLLPGLFPGCDLRKWQPHPEKLKGNVKRAIDEIDEVFIDDLCDVLTYKELCDRLNMDPANFRRTVRGGDSFWQALRERGLEQVVDETTKAKGLQRSASTCWDCDDEEEEATGLDGLGL